MRERPRIVPDWTAVFNVTRELVNFEERARSSSMRTLPVWIRQMLKRIEGDLRNLHIEPPSDDLRGEEWIPAIRRLGSVTLVLWAKGEWPSERQVEEGATDLGLDLLDRVGKKSTLSEEEAMELAVEAQHETRRRRL